MPEGDTIARAARTLHRALAGQVVTRFASLYPALTRIDEDRPIAGRTIESVSARGKHLFIAFSDDLVLHTHMRMNGSWHIYRPGERWGRSPRDMRITVGTEPFIAVAFAVPVAEFLTAAQLGRHEQVQSLGPDLADPLFDPAEARRRLALHGNEPIHDVLLNQRVLAGIGNVLKSEVLFVAGIDPFALTGMLTDAQAEKLLEASRRLMRMNTTDSSSRPGASGRQTTGSLDPSARLFVYGRGGKPCRRCGTAVQAAKNGAGARITYWCPRCQPT